MLSVNGIAAYIVIECLIERLVVTETKRDKHSWPLEERRGRNEVDP